ncbi:nucleotide sugar dehydrogenase [Planctomicrobium piriforme]|uniref:UDP-N-acetyl-D-mannosaminuronic acid dehydrogenase n=1 Tax=Planctomicrobium piriforme TaxID=1576369 RepID=A0A1I3MQG6_9PLAN|nr:nucleotide sugar dehydrogenase [Planctomicrobium piriforme]SFI99182.1 UDP-N-acetyl-D-mannosaminuronic acid dehydrogenase [Planctomicrobium piriforme]
MSNETFPPISRVAVVGGAGHVGLPLALLIAQQGFDVTIVDINEETLALIRSGKMPFHERDADELLPQVLATGRLHLTSQNEALRDQDLVIVTIGTPVDEYLDPDVRTFDRVIHTTLSHMRDGQLLMIRSTVFPGVTDRLGRQVSDHSLKVDVAYCPERIAQGFALQELVKLPQIVSGTTPRAAHRAAEFFERLRAEIIELPPIEAELAKLFSNSYRYINFAIANQFYMLAERYGADFERVRDAVTRKYPRMQGFSGAGFAAGPCLLKDTMQLAAFNHNVLTLGQNAMMINEGLPRFLVDQLKTKHDLVPLTVGVLGMAFKANCDDPRSSLSYKLRKVLTMECRKVLCTDPYIQNPEFVSLEECLAQSDILIVGACHDEYRNIQTNKPIVDVFGFLPKAASRGSAT